MFPSLNLCPSLSHLRALRALLSSFCELTRTFSVTQTHSVTFIPSKYIYNHGDGEDEREHLPQVRTKSIFFPSQSVKKALSLLPGRAHQSLSEGHLEAKEKKKSKLLGPELFSFSKERFIFNQKKDKSLFLEGGGVHPSFIFFLLFFVCPPPREGLCFVFKQTTHLLRFCFIIHKTTQNTGYHRSTTSTVSRPYRTSNNRTSFSTTGRRTRITCSSTRWRTREFGALVHQRARDERFVAAEWNRSWESY